MDIGSSHVIIRGANSRLVAVNFGEDESTVSSHAGAEMELMVIPLTGSSSDPGANGESLFDDHGSQASYGERRSFSCFRPIENSWSKRSFLLSLNVLMRVFPRPRVPFSALALRKVPPATIEEEAFLSKFATAFLALLVSATPTFAFTTEEIGMIEANFDGVTIAQTTVLARDGDEASATAFMFLSGVTATLSIAGYSTDNARLSVEVDFMTERPGPETPPLGVTISYAPRGTPPLWTSEERPTAPTVTFTTLEANDQEGRVAGTFAAELCLAEDYEGGGDPGNCQMIEGRFDTRFFVER